MAINRNSFTVWEEGAIHLDYHNDNLHYYSGKSLLPFKATSSLPVRIKNRTLFFQADSLFVLEGKDIINTFKIKDPISQDYEIYAYKKWVNICSGGEANWLLCYSYEKNKFYRRN